jgi:uncharacterized protein YaeQ
MKYAFIRAHQAEFGVRAMCRVLRVHFSGFYAWLKEPLSRRAQDDARQTELIRQAWGDSGKVYGYRKHPSETDERMMVRIIAFALNAHENLEMTKGISTEDEPDIWQKSLSGELDVWVALGLPSEKVMRQSCSKADKVIVYPYGGRTADIWWDKIKGSTTRFENLQVIGFSEKDTGALANLANRTMKLQINIQDGEVMVSAGDSIVYLTPLKWKSAA